MIFNINNNISLKNVCSVLTGYKMWFLTLALGILVLAKWFNILSGNYVNFFIAITVLFIIFALIWDVKQYIKSIKYSRNLLYIFKNQLRDIHKGLIFLMIAKGGTAVVPANLLPLIIEINQLGFIYGKSDKHDNKNNKGVFFNAVIPITLKTEAVRMVNSKNFKKYKKTLSEAEVTRILKLVGVDD